MNKIILILILSVFFLSVASAIAPLSVNSIRYQSSNGTSLTTANYTGERIIINLTAFDPLGIFDVKRVFLSWNDSLGENYLDCVSKIKVNNLTEKYTCIFTITPNMTSNTEIFANTETISNNNVSILVGTFNLKGNRPNPASEFVQFIGNWSQGATLFSNFYNVTSIQGQDVFPLPLYCNNTVTCSSYSYHWNSTCVQYKNNKCVWHQLVRVNDGCVKYTNFTACTYYPTPICYNADGKKTNKFDLSNFYYTINGVNWKLMNYSVINITHSVRFKVVIPGICMPTYNINNSINVTK